MRQVHAITAFSRWENLDFYLRNLEDTGIIWHPIIEESDEKFNLAWVQPFYCHNRLDEGNVFYRRLNTWIRESRIEDEDYYIFLNDDDWIGDSVARILPMYSDDVIFASMLRGNRPVPGHPITPLHPFLGVRAGSIGVEQIILKGKILRQVQFDVQSGMADGQLAEYLQTVYPIKCAPELVMYFNYLEPGRW